MPVVAVYQEPVRFHRWLEINLRKHGESTSERETCDQLKRLASARGQSG
jgi:hypothetical protein